MNSIGSSLLHTPMTELRGSNIEHSSLFDVISKKSKELSWKDSSKEKTSQLLRLMSNPFQSEYRRLSPEEYSEFKVLQSAALREVSNEINFLIQNCQCVNRPDIHCRHFIQMLSLMDVYKQILLRSEIQVLIQC